MVEKTALTEQELAEKLKEMAPEWKTGKNEKSVPYIQRVHHARKFMEGIDFVRAWEFMWKSKTSDKSPIDSDDSPDMFG